MSGRDFVFFGLGTHVSSAGEVARKNANDVADKYLKNKHEYMRITRMLKFFGETGFDRLQAPLCEHFQKSVEM